MKPEIIAKHFLAGNSCYNCSRAGPGNIECFRKIEGEWRWYSVSRDHICEQWNKY